MQPHNIQSRQTRIQSHKQRRNNGKVFCHIVSNGEGGQAASCHQKLFADAYNVDQFCRRRVQIHHIACFFCCLCAAVHGNCNVCLCQSRGVVGAVACHGYQVTLGLKIPDHCQLSFRGCFRKKIIHTGLGSNGRSCDRIVAGDHNGLDTHFSQVCKFLLHTLLDNILQIDNAEDLVVLSYDQRCAALGRNRLDNSITVRRIHTACMGHITLHGVCCAFSDFVAVKVDAAHTGHGSKWDKVHILVLKASATNSKLFLGQHDNASALRGLVCQRRKLSGVCQFLNIYTIYRNELRCLSIAQSDGSGFVKHPSVYITGGFNGASTHGQNICLVQSGHTGNTDGRKQGTNGSRSKAYQQRNQSCYRGGILNSCQFCRKNRISVEGDCY